MHDGPANYSDNVKREEKEDGNAEKGERGKNVGPPGASNAVQCSGRFRCPSQQSAAGALPIQPYRFLNSNPGRSDSLHSQRSAFPTDLRMLALTKSVTKKRARKG